LAANAIARDSGSGRTGRDSLKEVQDVIWINTLSGQPQYPDPNRSAPGAINNNRI
jgi:hypothetical protein